MKKIFVDTNILVSAYDASNPNKRQKALQLAVEFTSGKFEVCLSTQVLQEFYSVPTSKLKIPPALALVELRNNLGLNIVQVAPNIIIEAANLNITDSVSFWDALIVCAAKSAGCEELWTEDMQAGRKYGSLTIVNPL